MNWVVTSIESKKCTFCELEVEEEIDHRADCVFHDENMRELYKRHLAGVMTRCYYCKNTNVHTKECPLNGIALLNNVDV